VTGRLAAWTLGLLPGRLRKLAGALQILEQSAPQLQSTFLIGT
jgi:hypothetical protein